MADAKETINNSEPLSSVDAEQCNEQNVNAADCSDMKPDKDLVVEAVQHFQQGKRHMIVSDFKSAVPSFEQACKLLDTCYGTGAAECGEAYLNYGIALFELSRIEEGIMDGVVNVDNQNSTDEEEEEDGGDGNDEEEEQANINGENEDTKEETPADETIINEDQMETDPNQPSTSKGDTGDANGDKSDEDDEADNASSVEIAWEVLSLARDIFANTETLSKENRLNLAEALQKLGEISIEWENNENAVHMLSECLEHRKEVLQPDDRLIAVTYHYLGIAFSFKNDPDKANSCFESALDVIQMRIKHLKDTKIDNLDQFEKDAHQREINQLEDLIPELQSKIDDLREQMQSQYKTLESLQKESEKEEKINQFTNDKPISNISHLIKRKKEATDGETTADGESEVNNKKARVDINNSLADPEATEAN